MRDNGEFSYVISDDDTGKRLDQSVSDHLENISRSQAAGLIRDEAIRVGNSKKKPGYKVKPGDCVHGRIPPPETLKLAPEAIPLDVIFEDRHLIVLNKQAGIVVHPSPGHFSGTLVNALLNYFPELHNIGGVERPGIVHRLDKDTSGLIVIAKTSAAHLKLSQMFKQREIYKSYIALAYGEPDEESGVITHPIGRHPADRKKMSVNSRNGRDAVTEWHVAKRFPGCSLIKCVIKTGRTHQIRVHLSAINHPIIGDPVYTKGRKKMAGKKHQIELLLKTATRQMLHSEEMAMGHPITGERMSFTAPLPMDMRNLINKIENLDCI